MSILSTVGFVVIAVALVLAPKALDSWLSVRADARVSQGESRLDSTAGGAE